MASVTIARGGTSVTLDLLTEGGQPLITRDVSKPAAKIEPKVAGPDPRYSDQFAGFQTLTIGGAFTSATAYEDAHTLAEELIKPNSGGTDLTVTPSGLTGYQSSYIVAPQPARALTLEYEAGQRDWVVANLQLPVVDQTVGTGSTGGVTTAFQTPQQGVSVNITNPESGTTASLDKRLRVRRFVGRPQSAIRPQPSSVKYVDKRRAATDEFEIEAEFADANAESDAQSLIEDVLLPSLGRQTMTLDFNGLYGLGSYDVAPGSSTPGRDTASAGEQGQRSVGPLNFRVARS